MLEEEGQNNFGQIANKDRDNLEELNNPHSIAEEGKTINTNVATTTATVVTDSGTTITVIRTEITTEIITETTIEITIVQTQTTETIAIIVVVTVITRIIEIIGTTQSSAITETIDSVTIIIATRTISKTGETPIMRDRNPRISTAIETGIAITSQPTRETQ